MNNLFLYFIFAFIALDILVVVIVFVKRSRKKMSKGDLEFISDKWTYINQIVNSNPSKAVIDADKLIDFVLQRKKFSGSFSDKLKASGNLFSDLNSLWSAHKLRNRIAHEFSEINVNEIKSALRAYHRALKDLNVL